MHALAHDLPRHSCTLNCAGRPQSVRRLVWQPCSGSSTNEGQPTPLRGHGIRTPSPGADQYPRGPRAWALMTHAHGGGVVAWLGQQLGLQPGTADSGGAQSPGSEQQDAKMRAERGEHIFDDLAHCKTPHLAMLEVVVLKHEGHMQLSHVQHALVALCKHMQHVATTAAEATARLPAATASRLTAQAGTAISQAHPPQGPVSNSNQVTALGEALWINDLEWLSRCWKLSQQLTRLAVELAPTADPCWALTSVEALVRLHGDWAQMPQAGLTAWAAATGLLEPAAAGLQTLAPAGLPVAAALEQPVPGAGVYLPTSGAPCREIYAQLSSFMAALPPSVMRACTEEELYQREAMLVMQPRLFWRGVWRSMYDAAQAHLPGATMRETLRWLDLLRDRCQDMAVVGDDYLELRDVLTMVLDACASKLGSPSVVGLDEAEELIRNCIVLRDRYGNRGVTYEPSRAWLDDLAHHTVNKLGSTPGEQLMSFMNKLHLTGWALGPAWLHAWRQAMLPHIQKRSLPVRKVAKLLIALGETTHRAAPSCTTLASTTTSFRAASNLASASFLAAVLAHLNCGLFYQLPLPVLSNALYAVVLHIQILDPASAQELVNSGDMRSLCSVLYNRQLVDELRHQGGEEEEEEEMIWQMRRSMGDTHSLYWTSIPRGLWALQQLGHSKPSTDLVSRYMSALPKLPFHSNAWIAPADLVTVLQVVEAQLSDVQGSNAQGGGTQGGGTQGGGTQGSNMSGSGMQGGTLGGGTQGGTQGSVTPGSGTPGGGTQGSGTQGSGTEVLDVWNNGAWLLEMDPRLHIPRLRRSSAGGPFSDAHTLIALMRGYKALGVTSGKVLYRAEQLLLEQPNSFTDAQVWQLVPLLKQPHPQGQTSPDSHQSTSAQRLPQQQQSAPSSYGTAGHSSAGTARHLNRNYNTGIQSGLTGRQSMQGQNSQASGLQGAGAIVGLDGDGGGEEEERARALYAQQWEAIGLRLGQHLSRLPPQQQLAALQELQTSKNGNTD